MAGMGLAGIDDALELGVGQEAFGDDAWPADAAGRSAWAARPKPWRPTARAAVGCGCAPGMRIDCRA